MHLVTLPRCLPAIRSARGQLAVFYCHTPIRRADQRSVQTMHDSFISQWRYMCHILQYISCRGVPVCFNLRELLELLEVSVLYSVQQDIQQQLRSIVFWICLDDGGR
jgi:hypothetical protein